ncbi:MAG TPA: hypothetical protein VE871_02940 [Longimicrobium sp.]|nr:hypothetical protein [Longimicrobium sp.]
MRSVASILPLLLAAACSRTPGPDDAPGTYLLHLRDASDTLWVQPGGGFIHRYAADDGPPMVTRGTWVFEPSTDPPIVTFHGFPFRGPGTHATDPSRRGTWPASIHRTLTGTVVLPMDAGVSLRYHRISTLMLGSGAGLAEPAPADSQRAGPWR